MEMQLNFFRRDKQLFAVCSGCVNKIVCCYKSRKIFLIYPQKFTTFYGRSLVVLCNPCFTYSSPIRYKNPDFFFVSLKPTKTMRLLKKRNKNIINWSEMYKIDFSRSWELTESEFLNFWCCSLTLRHRHAYFIWRKIFIIQTLRQIYHDAA